MHLPFTMAAVLLGDGVGVADGVVAAGEFRLAALALVAGPEKAPRMAARPTPTPATITSTMAPTDNCRVRLARSAWRTSRRSCASLASLRWRSFFVATRRFLLLIRSVLRFCPVWQRPGLPVTAGPGAVQCETSRIVPLWGHW